MRLLPRILHFVFFLLIVSGSLQLKAQPSIEAEIDRIVTVLVKQINQQASISTVAIADFTDLAYQPNLLGKQLSEEFLSAFVGAPDKNFRLISRSMYEALLAEQKLDKNGRITPENLPQYGVLQGIDLILGATLSARTNTIRINLRGIELDTGSLIAAYSGNITLTPSYQRLIKQQPAVSQNVITGNKEEVKITAESQSSSATQISSPFQKGNLLIEVEGCSDMGSEIVCQFSVRSAGSDETMSLYCFSSSAAYSINRELILRPTILQLGEQKSNRRITRTLLANSEESLLVFLPLDSPTPQSVAELTIKCHTNSEGIFDISFKNIPISK